MNKIIKNIQSLLRAEINIIDDLTVKRCSKITSNDMIYYLSQLISSPSKSSKSVSSELNIEKISSAKDSAFRKKRHNLPSKYINGMSISIHNYYYENMKPKLFLNKYRLLSSDGTHSPLSKLLEEEGFKLTKNKTYVNASINGVYDVLNNLLIDFELSKKSEEDAYKRQLTLLRKNDIVIHDRKYYSNYLLSALHSKNVHSIFRMKKSSNYVKHLIENELDDQIFDVKNTINGNIIKLKVVRFKVEDEYYYIATTLVNENVSISQFKELYKLRWNIEEYFKLIKYSMSFKHFHSKKKMLIEQEIYMHQLITSLTRILECAYIEKIADQKLKTKMTTHNTNFSNNIRKVISKIIRPLIFNKSYRKVALIIKDVFAILFKYLIKIRPNRSYERFSITPPSKWYFYSESQ